MNRLAGPVVALALAAWFAPAHAGLFDDDEARKAILDIRQRIEQGNEQARKATAEQAAISNEQIGQLRRSLLELNAQLELLRAELAKLRGQDEHMARGITELGRDVAELQRRQKDIAQGVDDRMRKMEPQQVSLDGRTFMADPEEKRAYEEAMAVFRKGDFGPAAAALGAFTRRYPASGYADSANFWLGNAYYGQRDYKQAIESFRSVLRNAPDHPRAPEALLSIANCQLELKDGKTARKTIDELMKNYPNSEAAQTGKERLAAIRG